MLAFMITTTFSCPISICCGSGKCIVDDFHELFYKLSILDNQHLKSFILHSLGLFNDLGHDDSIFKVVFFSCIVGGSKSSLLALTLLCLLCLAYSNAKNGLTFAHDQSKAASSGSNSPLCLI